MCPLGHWKRSVDGREFLKLITRSFGRGIYSGWQKVKFRLVSNVSPNSDEDRHLNESSTPE